MSDSPADQTAVPDETENDLPALEEKAALDLEPGDILYGESGNISEVYETAPHSLLPGFVTVRTEHGPLLLDDDREVTYSVVAV